MTSVFSYVFTLVTVSLVCLVLIDKLVFSKRKAEHQAIVAGLGLADTTDYESSSKPRIIHFAYEYWHWILLIYLVRAFGFESMSIPSSSMLPNIEIGEQVVVNKFSYGLFDPLFRHQIADFGQVKRGDVVVFRSPERPDTDYIKRVIGVPGDTITYSDKQLKIRHCDANSVCVDVKHTMKENGHIYTDSDGSLLKGYDVDLEGVHFEVVLTPEKLETSNGISITVPKNHYFMMGDNRDNSHDSRAFGVISKRAFVGKPSISWIQLRSVDSTLGTTIDFKNVGPIQPN